MGRQAGFAVRFARGAARPEPWSDVDRQHDWAPRSLMKMRESEEVTMVEVLIGEMVGSN